MEARSNALCGLMPGQQPATLGPRPETKGPASRLIHSPRLPHFVKEKMKIQESYCSDGQCKSKPRFTDAGTNCLHGC